MKPRPLIPTVPALLALASYAPAQDKQPAGAEKAAHAQVDACVALLRANAEINFRNGGSAEGSGEHTRPRVWCSASRRTGFSGGTPELARGDACAPQPLAAPTLSQAVPLEHLEGGPGAMAFSKMGSVHLATAPKPIWKFLSAFTLARISITQSEPPECEISGLGWRPCFAEQFHAGWTNVGQLTMPAVRFSREAAPAAVPDEPVTK
jgi:hypothetical protein